MINPKTHFVKDIFLIIVNILTIPAWIYLKHRMIFSNPETLAHCEKWSVFLLIIPLIIHILVVCSIIDNYRLRNTSKETKKQNKAVTKKKISGKRRSIINRNKKIISAIIAVIVLIDIM